MTVASLDDARAAKARALELFRPLADVVGVGITRLGQGYAVKVNLRQPPTQGVEIPSEVEGVPVQVEVVGPIRKR